MTFEENICKLLNINFLQNCCNPSIKQYQLKPQTGKGTCKIIQLGCHAAIILFDCSFLRNYTYFVQDKDLLHISYYIDVHSAQSCFHTNQQLLPNTFYAHLGCSKKSRTTYENHTPVKSIHIFLTPKYYDTYLSKTVPDCSTHLKEAISLLNEMECFPELSFVLHQLYSYQGSDLSSLLFYKSKLTEILALILHKSLDSACSLTRHVKQSDIETVQQIAEYISSHVTQEVSLDSLAHMAYMSPAKLKYVFKSVYHCSIRDYRLQKRMHVAKEFLYHTDLPVSDIAAHLGYHNSGNFSAIFKKHTGFSPKDFRLFSRTSSLYKFSSQ